MSNSAKNEYRTVSGARGIVLLVCWLVGIFVQLSSVVLADDSDIDRTKSIIAMIQQPDAPDRNRVDERSRRFLFVLPIDRLRPKRLALSTSNKVNTRML